MRNRVKVGGCLGVNVASCELIGAALGNTLDQFIMVFPATTQFTLFFCQMPLFFRQNDNAIQQIGNPTNAAEIKPPTSVVSIISVLV